MAAVLCAKWATSSPNPLDGVFVELMCCHGDDEEKQYTNDTDDFHQVKNEMNETQLDIQSTLAPLKEENYFKFKLSVCVGGERRHGEGGTGRGAQKVATGTLNLSSSSKKTTK